MKKRYSISTKVFWLALTITVVSTSIHTFIAYNEQQKAYLDGVNKKLLAAAMALPRMLPADAIHDKITGPDSISPQEYSAYLSILSEYTKRINISYLYTYIQIDDTFRVATTSTTPGELNNDEQTAFFTEYENVPEQMLTAWKNKSIQYAEYTDKWGHFRSIFIPMRTKSGTPYIIGADVALRFVSRNLYKALIFHAETGLGITLLTLLIIWSIVQKNIKPISWLAAFTKELASTDFYLPEEKQEELKYIAEQYNDEVGQLAEAFREMQLKLSQYIDNLQRATAAKERIESELRIARDIQMSFLKKRFPPFPDRHEFDLYAIIAPAKEVGGDLYDFCLLDEDHLFFYIGDVAGKGVPAALFMAVTMTLMNDTAKTDYTSAVNPAEILKKVNISLSSKNESLLFVTLACFILNLKTGMLIYSNAGHNPPVLLRRDGTTEWMELPKGIVLGIMPEADFTTTPNT
ncbi:MAG: HAMP domain-containing protein, partial [Candidatus Electrothrix sp. AUS1_2]|nr:HAMP domain-containing protein [Candidatus Electrothrix sp. AUS1_2]